VRGDDVALYAIDVVEQRDAGRTIRIVLDRNDLGPFVSSAISLTVAPRRPGDVGLFLRMPMALVISYQFSVVSHQY
jgi:hypothetical protein